MRRTNEVTEEFLRRFSTGEVVDVKEVRGMQRKWTGPHKLVVYKLGSPTLGGQPAAFMEIDLGAKGKLVRWLIVGISKPFVNISREEQKQRVRAPRPRNVATSPPHLEKRGSTDHDISD